MTSELAVWFFILQKLKHLSLMSSVEGEGEMYKVNKDLNLIVINENYKKILIFKLNKMNK